MFYINLIISNTKGTNGSKFFCRINHIFVNCVVRKTNQSIFVLDEMVRVAPMNFVATMAKSQRDCRIFIDYLRNQKGSTSIAPYSTRARTGATVSTPLRWNELSVEVTPADYTLKTVPERLATLGQDPWADFGEVRQSITIAMKRALKIS